MSASFKSRMPLAWQKQTKDQTAHIDSVLNARCLPSLATLFSTLYLTEKERHERGPQEPRRMSLGPLPGDHGVHVVHVLDVVPDRKRKKQDEETKKQE